jgi:hypothetical protein
MKPLSSNSSQAQSELSKSAVNLLRYGFCIVQAGVRSLIPEITLLMVSSKVIRTSWPLSKHYTQKHKFSMKDINLWFFEVLPLRWDWSLPSDDTLTELVEFEYSGHRLFVENIHLWNRLVDGRPYNHLETKNENFSPLALFMIICQWWISFCC